MINTFSIKQEQNKKGFFTTGSGLEVILIQGSCRVAPYCSYLDIWNKTVGNNRFTIHSYDPFNLSFHPVTDSLVDRDLAILDMEKHNELLKMLSSVDYFIHEHYESFGMFNTVSDKSKNIYQFGLNPKIDLCVPNFHDVFIMFSDFYTFDKYFKEGVDESYATCGKLTSPLKKYVQEKAEENLQRFYEVCRMSSFPVIENVIKEQICQERFFWTFNHVSNNFTKCIFNKIASTLNLEFTQDFINDIADQDMFSSVFTPLTEYDVEVFGFNWGEPVVSFKEYNKIGQ